LMFYQPIS